MRVMVVGDTHGRAGWLRKYIFPVAMVVDADAIVVVGDYGAWEHEPAGVLFMNEVDQLAAAAGVPLYWLHGNHDKWSHTMKAYGEHRDERGFVVCRKNVFYIPQGLSWSWAGTTFRSFGGAYSIDRSWRINAEKERYNKMLREARYKVSAGKVTGSDVVPSQEGTLWFPEEEMTDAEIEQLLLDDFERKDVILSHDKPLSAHPDWERKDFPACVPNQIRLDRAMRIHKPQWWIHGHLHYHYVDTVFGADWKTTVVGLDPDSQAAESSSWARENTWVLLNLVRHRSPDLQLGRTVTLNPSQLVDAREALASVPQ